HALLLCCLVSLLSFTASPTPDSSTRSLHAALPISILSCTCLSRARMPASIYSRRTSLSATPGERRFRKATGAGCGDDFSEHPRRDRKSTRLNSSHVKISYAVFCLKKKRGSPYSGVG